METELCKASQSVYVYGAVVARTRPGLDRAEPAEILMQRWVGITVACYGGGCVCGGAMQCNASFARSCDVYEDGGDWRG
jgi:hypothetical protein